MSVGWGIAGTGGIAREFAQALTRVDGGELTAVGSRTDERAQAFAHEVGARRAHGSLTGLLSDDDVDVVYIASPQSEHAAQAEAALHAGKHVLVEKPFSLDLAQAERVVAAARSSGRFLMEAMWSRFLPAYGRLRHLVDDGAIGEVRAVHATFGFPVTDPASRLLDPALGGGALLDLGVYPVHLATWLLGAPHEVAAVASLGLTGVDLHTAVSLGWSSGAVATAQASITTWLPMTGLVVGSAGWVELPLPHHCPEALTVHRHPTSTSPLERTVERCPIGGDGLRFEIAHVQECLASGLVQSPVMPWRDSLLLMGTLDRVRQQIRAGSPADPNPLQL